MKHLQTYNNFNKVTEITLKQVLVEFKKVK